MARFSTRLNRRRVPKSVAVLLGGTLLVGVIVLSPIQTKIASGATTLIDDTFANPTSQSLVAVASNGTTGLSDQSFPCLTAGPPSGYSTIPNCDLGSPDPPRSGALMLTDAGFYEASNVI